MVVLHLQGKCQPKKKKKYKPNRADYRHKKKTIWDSISDPILIVLSSEHKL